MAVPSSTEGARSSLRCPVCAYVWTVEVADGEHRGAVVATVPLGGRFDDIVAAPHGEHVYVVVGSCVKVINRAHHLVATYPTGRHPKSLLPSVDGRRIHVTGYDGNTAVIDTATASVKMLALQRSNAEAISPDGSHLYQLHTGIIGDSGSAVSVISAGGATVAVVPVDKHASCLAVSPDGAGLFVASRPSPSFQDWRGSISVIDTATRKVVDRIAVELTPDTVAVSRDGNRLYATHYHKNSFSIVDLGRGGVVRWALSDAPTAVTVTPDGATAFITNLQSLIAIDTKLSGVKRISVGALPRATHLSPDGRRAYVLDLMRRMIWVLDTADHSTVGSLPVPGLPQAMTLGVDGEFLYLTDAVADTVTVVSTTRLTQTPKRR